MSWRLRRLVAGTTALLLMLPAVATAQTDALEAELRDRAQAREQVEEDLQEVALAESAAQRRLREAQEALDAAEAELAAREQELAEARERLAAARDELAAATSRAAEAHERYLEATQALEETELDLAHRQGQLDARIRAAFKYGQVSFAEAFTGVRDIADFLNSSTYVGRVMENDRTLVQQVVELLELAGSHRADAHRLRLEATREAEVAAAAEAAAAAATAQVAAATADQRRLTAEVDQRRAAQQVALEGLREDKASLEGHLAGLDAESGRIEQQLAEIARQQAAEAELRRLEEERRQEEERQRLEEEERKRREEAAKRPVDSGDDDAAAPGATPSPAPSPSPTPSPAPERAGNWVRPVTGALTSPFGPRWGRNHNGVDLAGGVGASVVASRDGLVVHVTSSCHPSSSWGCGGGFGNYVTIAHADGMATVYAHLSAVSVVVGQNLAAGQGVGQVGNSGNSYGSHLHFEVREGGVPRDPCGYIGC
ncbi:murein hydrolase activator EnvC [Egicoccus sp. AB-alg6-2]|uniref:murein hydrolase activator EnvC family protein n=1 Tax=Egicoccus sp. AB-alg6-2 TaxID=3242692 RepID=UPI00359DCEED